MIQLKPGVSLKALSPQMVMAFMIVASVFEKHNAACTCTSANDSTHKKGSKHYVGNALDFRVRDYLGDKHALTEEIEKALGGEFDVVLESVDTPNQHIHCEYDPA